MSLFETGYREPWKNLTSYIVDTQERRIAGEILSPEDFYYVLIHNGNVYGMTFFTIYPDKFGFVGYMGVDRYAHDVPLDSRISARMLREILKEIDSQVNAAGCEGFFFELEIVPPEYLDLRRKDKTILTKRERAIRERIKTTDVFQEKEARKLGWVTYRQPKLEWDKEWQDRRMHLMFVPATREPKSGVNFRDRSEVERYLRFVYQTYHWEGYKATEKGMNREKRLKDWKMYLDKLYKFAVDGIPSQIPLQKIYLGTPRPKVFVSYPDKDRRLAELVTEYLESLGFPVFYWGKDAPRLVGKWLGPSIRRNIDDSGIIVLILTLDTPNAKGQQLEIDYIDSRHLLYNSKKTVLPFISEDVTPSSFSPQIPSNFIHARFGPESFHNKIAESINEIIKSK